jgi:hypothetical protein
MNRLLTNCLLDIFPNLRHAQFYLSALENSMAHSRHTTKTKEVCGVPQREVDTPDAFYNFIVRSLEVCEILLWRLSPSKLNGATSGTETEVVPRGHAYRLPVVVKTIILFLLGVLHLPPPCRHEKIFIEHLFSISSSMP